MEFWNLYGIIRKRLWMVLFLVIATVASTLFTVMTRPPTYKGVATVRVGVDSPSVADVGRLDWYTTGILFSTIEETILSRSILQEVIDQNYLDLTTDDFRNAVGVGRIGNSNLLKVEVKSTNPELSKRLANSVAATFIQYNQRLLDTQSASSIAYYEEQLKLAEENYNKAKENFRTSLNQPNARAAENQFIGAQATYQAATDKLESVRLLNRFPDLRPASVTIAEPAVTPTEPEGRQVARYTLIALLVSLLLGIFIAMSLEYLDLSIKSPYEITSELGLAVVGVIPHFRRGVSAFASVLANLDLPLISPIMRWRIRRLESHILSPEKLPVDSTETFRKARISLMASHRERAAHGHTGASKFLITSSSPRGGKTTMTAHLGIILSRAGSRVLLIDGDFRHPRLHLHFGQDLQGPGLAELLKGEASLNQAVRETEYPRLAVIYAGDPENTQPELLESDRLAELLARTGPNFDFILVDSPALGLYTDAAVLAAQMDGVLLVIDATRPSSESELRSLSLLSSAGAVVEGVILNKINPDYIDPTRLRSLPRHIVETRNGHLNGLSTNGHARKGAEVGPTTRLN